MANDPRDNMIFHHMDNSGNPVFYNPEDGQYHTNTGEQTGHFISGESEMARRKKDDFFTQPGKRPMDRYNSIYRSDYKTGAQASVFFGPIYLEECIQISWTTSSGDTPLYNYMSRFWNTLVQGNHIIQGQFSIPFFETDYIYRNIKEYELIQQKGSGKSVADAIAMGKNRFYNTLLSYRRRASPNGDVILTDKGAKSRSIEDITDYVDYLTNRRILDLEHSTGLFDLAIVFGNYKEKDFAIRSFTDCKIIGTGQQVQQDDGHLIEVYNFLARVQSIPERRKKTVTVECIEVDPIVVLADLEKAIREIGKTIELWPSLESSAIDRYLPGVLDSVDNVGIVGLPNNGTGIYGHTVRMFEPQWFMYYDKLIPLPEPTIRTNKEGSGATIKLFDENRIIRDTIDNQPVLVNDGTFYLSPKENLPYINAIANVVGRGVVGSGIPPTKIPLADFRWHEFDNKFITGSILWSGLISNETGYWYKYLNKGNKG